MNRNEREVMAHYVAIVGGYVKRANMRGQLWPMPDDPCSPYADAIGRLELLGDVEWVEPTPTSLGGWHWVPRERA